MGRRDHLRTVDEPGRRRRDDTAPARDAAAASMLALQRSAGNRALGALLARAPSEDERETEAPQGAARVTLEGIGVIRVLSVHLPASGRGPRSGGAGGGRDRSGAGEVRFTSVVGPHSAVLSRAAAEGRSMSGQIDFAGGMQLTLANAIVSSYLVSETPQGATESWTLDATAITDTTPRDRPED